MEYKDLYSNNSPQYEYAGFGLRLIAYFIDAIVLSIILKLLSLVFGFDFNTEISKVTYSPGGLVAFLVSISYFVYFETGIHQATIGKRMMDLKVIKQDGTPLSKVDSIFRYLGKILSAIIFLIGYIMVIFDDKKRALHDRIASTYVIKAK
ncbi:MAG: RDD family protein [Chitinophagales bacterium]|nr:RDD family protein [Chitinophagales bacterium]